MSAVVGTSVQAAARRVLGRHGAATSSLVTVGTAGTSSSSSSSRVRPQEHVAAWSAIENFFSRNYNPRSCSTTSTATSCTRTSSSAVVHQQECCSTVVPAATGPVSRLYFTPPTRTGTTTRTATTRASSSRSFASSSSEDPCSFVNVVPPVVLAAAQEAHPIHEAHNRTLVRQELLQCALSWERDRLKTRRGVMSSGSRPFSTTTSTTTPLAAGAPPAAAPSPSGRSSAGPALGGGGSSSTSMKKKQIMTVTDKASERIGELMELDATCKGIRISLRQRGCSGMSYVMDFQKDAPGKFDEVIDFSDALGRAGRVVVDGKAVLFLVGTEMDYVEVEMGSEFVFNNPNQKSSCGCGQSFNV
ncbi:unnamed protein product [Amoebophrya sp. A120]|nr:unnamed protein product [Amoebophrya sp. A120]|eukprot:GSA120T00000172001.1